MPAGIGFELLAALALVGVLILGVLVAWLRHGSDPEAASEMVEVDTDADPSARSLEPKDRASVFNGDASLSLSPRAAPAVVLVVGARGSGCTTMAGKLALRLVNRGRLVAVTAIGGVRLDARRELASLAERAGAELVLDTAVTDPAARAYEAVDAARSRGFDVLIIDTDDIPSSEGSMEELTRMSRVLERAAGRVDEVLLVVDATDGETVARGRAFHDAVDVTGVAVSKLDRAQDPADVLAAAQRLPIPVEVVGTGGYIRGF